MSTLKEIYKSLFCYYYVESAIWELEKPLKSSLGPAFLQGEYGTHL